jgi:hypothetical protein
MRKLNHDEIIFSFSEKMRKKVKISIDLSLVDWENLDYLGWNHPSGHLAYMVYENEKRLRGVILSKGKPGNKKVAKMCTLCKTIHSNLGVVLFSSTVVDNKNISRSTYICSDLQCSLRVRGKIHLGPNQMGETISREEKIIRLIENTEKFINSIYS